MFLNKIKIEDGTIQYQWNDNITDEPVSPIFENFNQALQFLLEKSHGII